MERPFTTTTTTNTTSTEPKEQKVAEEYLSSLADLNLNSKPLINMLTILAEENMEQAGVIVQVVEQHISKVNAEVKLPVLYLLDSIVKNVGGEYIQLFSHCIVNIFCGVFEKVNEKVREKMYTLRQTWNDVFTPQKLYTLDVKVNCMDPNWPITAKVVPKSPAIHLNPKFLKTDVDPSDMNAKLQAKQRHLLELQKRKLELELAATKQRLEEQEKHLNFHTDSTATSGLNASKFPGQIGGHVNSSVNIMHVNRTMYDQYKGAIPQLPNMGNAGNMFSNYGQSTHNLAINNRSKIASANPGNPGMMNAVNKRDPRLARQQIPNHKQNELKKLIPAHHTLGVNDIDQSIRPPGTYEERENLIKPDDSRSALNNKTKPRSNSNSMSNKRSSVPSSRKDYGKSSSGSTELKSSSSSRSAERNGTNSSRSGSSKSSNNISSPSKYNDKDHSSRRKDKSSMDSKKRSQSKESVSGGSGSSKSERTTKNFDSAKGGSISPKSLQQRHQSHRSKDKTKSPSPSKTENNSLSSEVPDKRLKLSTATAAAAAVGHENKLIKKSNTPNSSTSVSCPITTTTTTTTTEKLDKNLDAEQNKDIDLRSFQNAVCPSNLKEEIEKMATGKPTIGAHSVMDRADEIRASKKRQSVDNKQEEPDSKKLKSEKIDPLFGSEDVDLRTEISTVLGGSGIVAPPPPSISNENENWDKVKGSKTVSRKISPIKSSLEDVRAKLAKAAKSNNYNFGKSRKNLLSKTLLNEMQEESQDGTDDNIRTIISQAQELLDTENINAEQYNTLVKTVIQINETNKLKEAHRRESLLDNKKHEESTVKVKEPRKRIPKIPKTDKSKDNVEQTSILKGLESQIPAPSAANTTSSYSDMPPGREEKEVKRKRQKESKWSSASAWDQQQNLSHKNQLIAQQKPWMHSNANSNLNSRSAQSAQQFPSKNLSNTIGSGHSLASVNNPWQNPPSMIFANPIQQIQAAASLFNTAGIAASTGSHFSNSVDNPQVDVVRTIPIDGVSKEIRVYDDVAIVFMDWDQPREIGFQNGQRRVIIDDQEPIALNFNDDYQTISIKGSVHRIKFGFPSRELYIDENWYESYFGGPQLSIPIDGQMHIIKIEGPPPQVNIGTLRQDIVVGKINLIVDAHIIIPVFLDGKAQYFELDQNKHMIQFADQLRTVLINNNPVSVEFGGLPKSVNLGGKKYFIRFGTLPNGVVPGRVNIKNMLLTKPIPEEFERMDIDKEQTMPAVNNAAISIRIPEQGTVLEATTQKTEISDKVCEVEKPTTAAAGTVILPLANVNIDELFQKLIASGILNNQSKSKTSEKPEEVEKALSPVTKKEDIVTPIDLSRPETIKKRQAGIVLRLFCGMQCSSCGLRFPPEQTIRYSQHLDWHFRQNRRERDSARRAHSRKWYYDIADWIQYEEIEDIEDREKNWFESQQNDVDNIDDNSNQRLTSPPPSCPAGPEDVDRACDVCHEKFEQFYNEEFEEWHLRTAIRVEDQLYHSICYQDFKASMKTENATATATEETNSDNFDDDSVIIVKQEKLDDDKKLDPVDVDDDDVIVVPMEEPSITEIPDDDDDMENNASVSENIVNPTETADNIAKTNDSTTISEIPNISLEDDLMIHEPNIPFTDLDSYVENKTGETKEESNQVEMNLVKIKEEPKDVVEEEEEDAFEDVGTFSAVEVIQDSPDRVIVAPTVPEVENADSDSVQIIEIPDVSLVSMDGNINIIDVTAGSSSGVSKIRINITKNVISNDNIDESNKSENVSTISVITTTIGHGTSSTVPDLINSSSSNRELNHNDDADIAAENQNDLKATPATQIENDDIDHDIPLSPKINNTNTNNNNNNNNKLVEIPNIEFSYKSELQNIEFSTVDKTESGFETSGLCSIM